MYCAHSNLLNRYNASPVGQIVLNYLLPIPVCPPQSPILLNGLAF